MIAVANAFGVDCGRAIDFVKKFVVSAPRLAVARKSQPRQLEFVD